jgi:hypothetical protein
MVSILAILCFLFVLNSYLRGKAKQFITVFLGFSIIGTISASFFILGWKLGLIVFVTTYVFLFFSHPFAKTLACKILGYRTGGDDEDDEVGIFEELRSLKSAEDLDVMMKHVRKKYESRNARLRAIARFPWIADVLQQLSVSEKEYQEIFESLWVSVPHDLAWEIVSSPKDLRELIFMKKQGKSDQEIRVYFRHR